MICFSYHYDDETLYLSQCEGVVESVVNERARTDLVR